MKKRARDAWHKFALFASAEREGRYRASLPVVEVDRREEWVFKALDRKLRRAYGDDWATSCSPSCRDQMIANVARVYLPESGGMYYQ